MQEGSECSRRIKFFNTNQLTHHVKQMEFISNSSCEADGVHKSCKSHTLENQLKINEDKIVAALTHFENTHKIVEDHL